MYETGTETTTHRIPAMGLLILCALVFALSIGLCPRGAIAADYYVNYATGNDANAGTSANPWKHCPGDPAATGQAASATLSGGDTVYFRTDATYVVTANGIVLTSGQSGNPVTYDGSSWGGGDRCIITGNNALVSNAGYAFRDGGAARNHIVAQGFNIQDIGGYTDDDPIWDTTTPVTNAPTGYGFHLLAGSSDILIDDCLFAEIGQWVNAIPMNGDGGITGHAISLENNSGITVSGCDFTRVKVGVSIKARSSISNISVLNSQFHNYMHWLIDIGPRQSGASLSNILVDGCTFYNFEEYNLPNWEGYGDKPHTNGIFLRASGMASTWSNIVIRNTLFYSDDDSDGGTSSIYISQGPSVDIYNCAFLGIKQASAALYIDYNKIAGMTQTVRVLNNTFACERRCMRLGGNADSVVIKNNVFYRNAAYDIVRVSFANMAGLDMDNNVFYGGDSARVVYYDGTGGDPYRTLAIWQSVSGKDANSAWGDPLFVDADVSNDPASEWDAHPTEYSPMVDAGANLSAYFTTDMDGETRTTPWEIGAFEYIAGNNPPVADAGDDQTVTDTDYSGYEIVTLNGTDSTDSDGSIVSYVWKEGQTQIATGSQPNVSLAVGEHTITLTVTDDDSLTNTDTVVITVNSPPEEVPVDLSSDFNMDAWCGPLEYQECVNSNADLQDLFGTLAAGNGYCILQQNAYIVCASDTMPYGAVYITEGQGSPEDGELAGDDRDYYIAGTDGSSPYSGDWTEVSNPATHVNNPNCIVVGASHNRASWQVSSVTIELDEGDKTYWNSTNFVLAAMNVADKARNMRILALYGSTGSTSEVLYSFAAADGGSGPLMTDASGGADFSSVLTMSRYYNVNTGASGGISTDLSPRMWEFTTPLELDDEQLLWGFRIEDVDPSLNWNARGLVVFACTLKSAGGGMAMVPGDADGDGDVDIDDFVILKQNYRTGASTSQGDFDGDGDVDIDDFVILKQNYGGR